MANCLNGRIDSSTHTHTHTTIKLKKKISSILFCQVFKDRKFLIHTLLKPGLDNFEHYFGSV